MDCMALCSSYVMSVRYVSAINHESRGRVAPEGRVIYCGNVPNYGHDISNLCRHDRVATDTGAKIRPKPVFQPVFPEVDITLIGS